MKAQMDKGSFNYIKRRKKRQGILSLIMFGIAFGIFLLGLCLNKFDKSNVFTILAVLFVLPSTKMLISFIILLPFHSVDRERYEEVIAAVPEDVNLFTDVVFSSTERVMMLDFLVIDHHYLICYSGKKDSLKVMEQYLRDGVTKRAFNFKVEAFDDFKRFKHRVSKLKLEESQKGEDYQELMEYVKSLMV